MEFNILNQSPILNGFSVQESLQHTVELATKADKLGYKRYFLSEHHNMGNLIGTAPEVLIAHLINHTKNINIGAGGIMLSHHNPFHVAEQFQLLSHLAPDRIDLGIGKAPGGTPVATKALQHELRPDIDSFNDRFLSLKSFVDGTHETRDELNISLDVTSTVPTLFLLGGSLSSARFAAENNVNYIFAHFIKNDPVLLKEISDVYKTHHPEGTFIVALSVLAVDNEEDKKSAVKENEFYELTFKNGRVLRVNTEKQVNEYVKNTEETLDIQKKQPDMILGTQEQILSQLNELSNNSSIDEFMFHLPTSNRALRDYTIETLAPIHTIHTKKAGIL